MSTDPIPHTDEEIPWPAAVRCLHDDGTSWSQIACLDWSRGDSYTRISGFRQAAEIIVSHVSSHPPDRDRLIFPFVYSWRQHLELALKQLIAESERLLDLTDKTPFGHNLEQLWTRCRTSLEEIGGASENELNNVAQIIMELHAMDPIGDAFRYPRSKDGSETLPEVDHLSFDGLHDAFLAVANFLEAAETVVSVKLELEADYTAYLSRQYRPGGY